MVALPGRSRCARVSSVRLSTALCAWASWGLSAPAWAGADTSPQALATGFGVATVFGLAGLVVGLALAGRRQPAAPTPVVCVGPAPTVALPAELPAIVGRQVWCGGDSVTRSRAAAGLARALSVRGPVLFLPDSQRRAAALEQVRTAPGVRWLEPNRPDLDAVHVGLNTLRRQGSSVVVVDGPAALEDPDALAALLATADVPVILLLQGGTSPPEGLSSVVVSEALLAALGG